MVDAARSSARSSGAVGFGAELLGVATGRPFGRYTYSDGLGPRVRGVPLLAAAAWALLARPAWVVAGRLSARRALRVPLAAGALTAWDVFLDPRMAREGYWTWPDGGALRGRPRVELRGLVRDGARRVRDRGGARVGAPGRDATTGRSRSTPGPGLGEAFANAALWRRPVVAVGGRVAMGAFAAPALWRRLR